MLGRPGDADYVAGLIAAWAPRYAVDAAVVQAERATLAQRPAEGSVEVHETGNGRFQQHVRAGSHVLTADEPRPMGEDTGPSPYDPVHRTLHSETIIETRRAIPGRGDPTGVNSPTHE